MAIEVFNRYETKYLIDTKTYNILINELEGRMIPDSYSRDNSFYTICNVYYDTADSALIRHSLSKPDYKEKLRLRSYGVPQKGAKVYLEIKKKYNGIVNKRRCALKLNEADCLVKNHIYPHIEEYMNRQVLNEIYYLVNRLELKPMVYIAYDRRAYFGRDNSDLRVTFDTNIRTRRSSVALEKGDYGEGLLGADMWLMEIKCAGALPLWLTKILSENHIYKTSFSKYGEEYKQHLINTEERNYA